MPSPQPQTSRFSADYLLTEEDARQDRPQWFDSLVLVSIAAAVVIIATAGVLWSTRPPAESAPVAASDSAAKETVASPSPSAPPTSPAIADGTTTPSAVPNTAVPPEPGSMYGNLSDSQIDAFVNAMALSSLPAETLAGFGRSTCTLLDSIRAEGPLDKNNVEQVRAELDEMVSLYLLEGSAQKIFGAADAERQLRRIDHFAAKYFCPPFYASVAAAHPEITE